MFVAIVSNTCGVLTALAKVVRSKYRRFCFGHVWQVLSKAVVLNRCQ